MKELKYLNKYFLKYKWHMSLGIIFVACSNFFSVKVPQEIRKALDYIIDKTISTDPEVLNQSSSNDILKFAGIVIGFSMLMGFFLYLMRKTIIVMSRLIEYDMRKEIYEHYQKLDLAFYKMNKTGDLMARISEDVSKVRMYLGPAIMYGINVSILFSFVIYSMFRVNSTLALYSLLPLPFLSLSIYYVSSIINKRSDLIQKQISKLSSISQEVYSGIRVIKSYVKENKFQHYFDYQSEDFKNKSLDLARVNALFHPLMILLVSLSTLLTIYIGGVLVAKGEITTGNIAEFVIYINMLTWPITSVGWIASIIQQAEASQKRINEMLRVSPEITNPVKESVDLKGEIEFRNVSFVYPDTGVRALNNFSFKVKRGEKLAILGRTASGKSTIADLLLRFYDVSEGQILVDGKDIRELDIYNLRDKIGYVPQDVFLFSESIRNNIAFGKTDATEAELEECAEKAAIKNDIMDLPRQFDTMVGERGVTLSGGQKQRVSIARALIKNPDIIVLDDCLSALDANTEYKILKYLDESLSDKSSIIITHRISNLIEFDKIIVIEHGELVEEGTHETLQALDGFYSQILKNQYETGQD
ncbi:MAG: ABC transporter ATP-binding protein [Saprospiraceae bacterium]|nr:ABC transporter ATP-binding protein [Chitinophagia bacterium]